MMMRMLETGGMRVLADGVRTANEDNPGGYYEFEAVKRTKEDNAWVNEAIGAAVKMVYKLVYDLPDSYDYRVLCMRRDMDEILASQRVMLHRSGLPTDDVGDGHLAKLFDKSLTDFNRWVEQQQHVQMLQVSYNGIQSDAIHELSRVNYFLGDILDVPAMAAIVDPTLYRNRS